MVVLRSSRVAIPFVLGVRDWRCFGVVFLWPPVDLPIQTGNMTLRSRLAAALAWRYRNPRSCRPGSLGVTLAAKLFLWPLVVWLAVTRRVLTAVLAVACRGRADRLVMGRDRLRRVRRVPGAHAAARGRRRHGLLHALHGGSRPRPAVSARTASLARGRAALLAALVLVGRRGDERRAFILAIAASLALTPIVWLHYFALLLLVVSLVQPQARAALVPAARHGRHARQRASDAVRDRCDSRGRGARRSVLRCACLWAPRGSVDESARARSHWVPHETDAGYVAERTSESRAVDRGSRSTRGRSASPSPWPSWTVTLFALVRDAFVTFRVGRFDLGNMVQAVWSTTQGRALENSHGADRRADVASRRPRRSVPRPPRAALAGLAVAALARASLRSPSSRWARFPSSGWDDGISVASGSPVCSRSAISRIRGSGRARSRRSTP